MLKIYSKINPKKLLHVIFKREDVSPVRIDISPEKEYIQVACFSLPKGKTFRAHKHLPVIRETSIT
jgi:hypothetical protein